MRTGEREKATLGLGAGQGQHPVGGEGDPAQPRVSSHQTALNKKNFQQSTDASLEGGDGRDGAGDIIGNVPTLIGSTKCL